MINLRQFEAHNNNISGIIPSSIGKLQSLEGLNLGNDRLSGFISSSLGNLTKLVEFHLETNHLQGSIPNTLGNCKRLLALNISQNSLDGSIPIEILLLPSLAIFLDLSHNRLSSSIPVQVGNLKNLGLLRLSDNMLSGKIPNNVGSCIMLEALYMDSNNFSGSIPQSLSSLRDGFSPANEIGRGGSGTVYKGILECPDAESIAVAVKVLNLVCHRGYKSFVAECEALRNARHRNLVKVVTVCSSVDHHGSLDDWLHNNRGTSTNTSSLNMIRRLNIGIDVGLAIEYLHNGCETPIMHWDLKPSNVRLDHQMTGRVSDFGLAKLVAAAEGSGSATNQWSSDAVDAEYGTGDEKSTKEDVYSYGILMLEMFTGKMGDLDLCTQHRRT
ncbi:Receptor kinase-like protein Xa21 [Linum grandiflorum]